MPVSTLKDIAIRLNLSISTVAGVLRGKPGFNVRTRKRVLEAARELHYQPDPMGRALRGGRSMTIGVLIGSFDPAILWKVQAIEAAARNAEYQAYVVFSGDRRDPITEPAIERLLARRVDGLIVYSLLPLSQGCCDLLRGAQRPVVFIDWAPRWARHRVAIRSEPAIADAVAHLSFLGHRRAVFMAIPENLEYPQNSIAPYRRAFTAAGMRLVVAPDWLVAPADGEDYPIAAYRVVAKRAKKGDVPTAVVTVDDEEAVAAMAAFADAGLRVPDDVSVVGYDDHPVARMVRPSLTTLRHPRGIVGTTAFQMLHRLIEDAHAPSTTESFDMELVVRQSTGPAPSK